jgi:hypothetical protein
MYVMHYQIYIYLQLLSNLPTYLHLLTGTIKPSHLSTFTYRYYQTFPFIYIYLQVLSNLPIYLHLLTGTLKPSHLSTFTYRYYQTFTFICIYLQVLSNLHIIYIYLQVLSNLHIYLHLLTGTIKPSHLSILDSSTIMFLNVFKSAFLKSPSSYN